MSACEKIMNAELIELVKRQLSMYLDATDCCGTCANKEANAHACNDCGCTNWKPSDAFLRNSTEEIVRIAKGEFKK